MTDRTTWANDWHQHFTTAVVGNDIATAVLALHKPNEDGNCDGCDAEGWDAEAPEWGCSTVDLIAGILGLTLQSRCPVCGQQHRNRTDGEPVGHLVRAGDMWVGCPGSPEPMESLPARTLDEVMSTLTQRLGEQAAAASAGIDADVLAPIVSPIPAAVTRASVKKWGATLEVAKSVLEPGEMKSVPFRLYEDRELTKEILPDADGQYRSPSRAWAVPDLP